MFKKLKKWIVGLTTATLLALAGYQIGTFDSQKGYPIIDSKGDTTWVDDSLSMTKFAMKDTVARWKYLIYQGVDTSKIWVQIKRGDQPSAQGFKNGMIIDYIDEFERGRKINFSDYNKKALFVVGVSRSLKPQIIEALKDSGNIDSTGYIKRKVIVAFDSLGAPGLKSELATTNKVDYGLTNNLPLKSIIPYNKNGSKAVKDVMTTTAGEYTIGGGGAGVDSFATMAAAFADLGNSTGAITFWVNDDLTETAESEATEVINHTFIVDSKDPHGGDPTAGHLISVNYDGNFIDFVGSGTGQVRIRNLQIKYTYDLTLTYMCIRAGGSRSDTMFISDCLFDGNGGYGQQGIRISRNSAPTMVWNCVFWEFDHMGMVHQSDAAASRYFSLTFNDCDTAVDAGGLGPIYANCIFFNSDLENIVNKGTSVGNNCATDHWSMGFNSGANNNLSLTVTNEVESQSDASADFMKVKSGGVCDTGGTATAGLNADSLGIRGNDRPGDDTKYSIGADEYLASEVISYDTTYRDTSIADSLRLACKSTRRDYADSMQVDSIGNGDTTVNWDVTFRDNIYYDTVDVVYPALYDTTYRDTTLDSACQVDNKLVEFYNDSMQIDSICFTDTVTNWTVSYRDSTGTDTTATPTYLDSLFSPTVSTGLIWDTDEGASSADTITDSITTQSDDTTFYWSREIARVCSTVTDSTHTRTIVDSIQLTLNYCSDAEISRDSFDVDTAYSDSSFDQGSRCYVVSYDTAGSPYLTLIAGERSDSWQKPVMFPILHPFIKPGDQ